MSKSQPFSIYLLKDNFDGTNSLNDDHQLEAAVVAGNLPDDATLYILASQVKEPWWKSYFQISKDLSQRFHGAIVFLPVDTKCFALCFGNVSHNLKDESYEYDFGLLVTLNCVDRTQLKSTDILEPSAARRRTTQPSIASDLTYFDFDRDSNILKKLTGKVKEEHKELFKQATGSSNLKITSDVSASDLSDLCTQLLALYVSEDYKEAFPGIRSIEPVKDPQTIDGLNQKLLEAFVAKDEKLQLAVPGLINFDDKVHSCFVGLRKPILYDDVYLGDYYQQLEDSGIPLNTVTIGNLRHHRLAMTDDNGKIKESYPIYKCLIFETQAAPTDDYHHLCDGNWYKVDKSYLSDLRTYLNNYYVDHGLLDYNHDSEGEYNIALSASNSEFICLDLTNISPDGQTNVEPCDIYKVVGDKAIFYHVKVSTLSQKLSHLFYQGTNSIELIKSEKNSKTKLTDLIKAKIGGNNEVAYLAPLQSNTFKVVYVMVTRKDKTKMSANLPLFSCISLRQSIKVLSLWNVDAEFCFVTNVAAKKAGIKKPRKKKAKKATEIASDVTAPAI